MTHKRNVLVLSAGRRVELVHGFQEALQTLLPSGKVYTADQHPHLSAACRISDGSFKAPQVSSPEYIKYLLDLCDENGIGMVVPTIDTELLALSASKQRFARAGVNMIISELPLVQACRDKRETAKVFDVLGIAQPEIYDRDAITLPCFCKPFDGSSSIGAQILSSASMLTEEILSNKKNMFMELIGKDHKEFTIDAYYNRRGELCCLVPRERIEVRGGEVSKGATRKNGVYHYLLDKLRKLEGAVGCVTIQIFANLATGSYKALEINPRFGGGFPLSYAAGAKYPDWLVREYFLNEDISFTDDWESDLLMLRYDAKVIARDHADA